MQHNATRIPLRVGHLLDGYCSGAFLLGPEQVRVEAIGADWVVVRSTDHDEPAQFYSGSPEDLVQYVGQCRGSDDDY
ncbi:hypothetical protein [Mycobacterium avium]|uniref:hypothetical protein n=1 Tax=Mycobacterium avium TaxID=1764 RepID=UPI000B4B4FC6|nr:hypothetical protein [Mycobacterium avium]